AGGGGHADGILQNFHDPGFEVSANFPGFDPVFDVRLNPVLDGIRDTGSAVNQGDAGSGPEQLQGGNRRRILSADHHHIVVIVRMRLLVIMNDFIQLFARNVQHVRDIVVSRSEYDFSGLVEIATAQLIGSEDLESVVGAGDSIHPLVLADVQL